MRDYLHSFQKVKIYVSNFNVGYIIQIKVCHTLPYIQTVCHTTQTIFEILYQKTRCPTTPHQICFVGDLRQDDVWRVKKNKKTKKLSLNESTVPEVSPNGWEELVKKMQIGSCINAIKTTGTACHEDLSGEVLHSSY